MRRIVLLTLFLGFALTAPCAESLVTQPKPDEYNLPEETRQRSSDAAKMPEPPPCLSEEEFSRRLQASERPPVLILTADRDIPFWKSNTIPAVLGAQLDATWRPAISLSAQPGEFRVFQLALVPVAAELSHFEIVFSSLSGADNAVLPAAAFRCLTLGGTLPTGEPLRKSIIVPRGTVQAVWIGIDIPNTARGLFRGDLKVQPSGSPPITVALTINIESAVVAEHGALDGWRLSRLRWLDSTIAREPVLPRGFTPVRVQDRTISLRGHRMMIGPDGLPAQIESTFSGSNTRTDAPPQRLLSAPMQLVAETEAGRLSWRVDAASGRPAVESDCAATWLIRAETDGLQLAGTGRLEFDGHARFRLRVTATRDLALSDLRLEIPYAETAARFFLGLGHAGGARPSEANWKWDVAKKNQDGFWLGAVNNGASWRFRDAHYRSPLVNIYYPFRPLVEPDSWSNQGKGGIAIGVARAGQVPIRVFSGPRNLRSGETLDFDFDLSLTPAKPIDTDRQWKDRIVHPSEGKGSDAIEAALTDLPQSSGTIISIHHRKDQNPFINYPYGDASFPLLRDFVRRAHEQKARVKIYYTTRELTQHVPELWALDSLAGEIITPGPGPAARTVVNKNGPEPWLSEHLRGSFIPAWRATLSGRFAGARDLAVITTPDSRWHNFYLEGLEYLCRHAAIDGIYLDDTALDRDSLLRARRILERNRPEPHIDLHSWNHFKPLGSFANSALLYTSLMPFLDRLWLGEGFDYSKPADFWLVEVAGIPFGVMSDMLQGGGNPWRGMLFGMTNQLGWNRGDPRPLWHYWDQFGMQDTEMIGWWDAACAVRTDRDGVLATVYRKAGRALIAVASWSDKDESITLVIDWAALGLNRAKTRAQIVAIDGFQDATKVVLDAPVIVPAGRGVLIELIEQ